MGHFATYVQVFNCVAMLNFHRSNRIIACRFIHKQQKTKTLDHFRLKPETHKVVETCKALCHFGCRRQVKISQRVTQYKIEMSKLRVENLDLEGKSKPLVILLRTAMF